MRWIIATRHRSRASGNRVYVAPDAPSSTHGQPTARTPYWQAGCAERRCAGGHSAPGDFTVFLAEVRAHIANVTGVDEDDLAFEVSLIGFSNGGKGVVNALGQLAAASPRVKLGDVSLPTATMVRTALDDAWRILASRPEVPRLTILVGVAGRNRERAAAFWQTITPDATRRIRLIPLSAGHHAIGDAAVDYSPLGRRTSPLPCRDRVCATVEASACYGRSHPAPRRCAARAVRRR